MLYCGNCVVVVTFPPKVEEPGDLVQLCEHHPGHLDLSQLVTQPANLPATDVLLHQVTPTLQPPAPLKVTKIL